MFSYIYIYIYIYKKTFFSVNTLVNLNALHGPNILGNLDIQ